MAPIRCEGRPTFDVNASPTAAIGGIGTDERVRHRIAIIAPALSAVAQPFSGGLVAHIWSLTRSLCERGHDVTLFAAPGSDPSLPVVELETDGAALSAAARRDVSMPPDVVMSEHHAYLSLMLQLSRQHHRWDVVHNHSLHHLPLAMARAVPLPMLTTLHTPPTPWLESAYHAGRRPPVRFAAVSDYTARQWMPLVGAVSTIPNGVDCARWPVGHGGPDLAWSGRFVPEKGPHVAILAARQAGRRICLAGPVEDRRYFDDCVRPLLSPDAIYLGHLDQAGVSDLFRRSAVLVASPLWDEPYGLVVAEALASGTPVAAFRRGGIPEVVNSACARLAAAGDVGALADAIRQASLLDRRSARRRAEQHCSVDTMVDSYETLLSEVVLA